MKKIFEKVKSAGQMTIMTTLILAASTLVGSAITAWATSSGQYASIDKRVEVQKTTEELHYAELSKKLDSIEAKLDRITSK